MKYSVVKSGISNREIPADTRLWQICRWLIVDMRDSPMSPVFVYLDSWDDVRLIRRFITNAAKERDCEVSIADDGPKRLRNGRMCLSLRVMLEQLTMSPLTPRSIAPIYREDTRLRRPCSRCNGGVMFREHEIPHDEFACLQCGYRISAVDIGEPMPMQGRPRRAGHIRAGAMA